MLAAAAAVGVSLVGCRDPAATPNSITPNPLTLHESSDAFATRVYVTARTGSSYWLNVYAFESTKAMFEFIDAANEDSAVTAITGFARNPGYYVVEIHVGRTTVRGDQRRARRALDRLAAEFDGFNAMDGPTVVVGPDGFTEMWMPRLESVYAGDNADYYNSLTDVTMAFSFDTEEDAVNAARYFADVYETQVSAGDDGRYGLLATRSMNRGDATDEASDVEQWIALLGGRFEWVGD